jgi:hypothetical protein
MDEELYGSVDRIVFRNTNNGWTVLDLETDALLVHVETVSGHTIHSTVVTKKPNVVNEDDESDD